jgi:hypothetical protein
MSSGSTVKISGREVVVANCSIAFLPFPLYMSQTLYHALTPRIDQETEETCSGEFCSVLLEVRDSD